MTEEVASSPQQSNSNYTQAHGSKIDGVMYEKRRAWVEIVNGIQSITTIIALAIGGAWALHVFYQNREAYPKVQISHVISKYKLNDNDILVRVAVTVNNI